MNRGEYAAITLLRDRLRTHMADLPRRTDPKVDALRDEVLAHAVAKATIPPDRFTLTVRVGGGNAALTGASTAHRQGRPARSREPHMNSKVP